MQPLIKLLHLFDTEGRTEDAVVLEQLDALIWSEAVTQRQVSSSKDVLDVKDPEPVDI